MGHRRIPTIYTLTGFEGEDGLIVRMKAIKVGKLRRLIRVVDSDGNEAESLDEIFGLMAEGLVSWNLEAESPEGSGNWVEVPATMAGIEEQDLPFILKILSKWLEEMTGVDEELGKDSSSGESFPGRPLTMEAL